MNNQRLIHDRQVAAGEHVRIWENRNGQFLFEHLMPTGKGVAITCASIDEALSLWRQVEKGDLPCQFAKGSSSPLAIDAGEGESR